MERNPHGKSQAAAGREGVGRIHEHKSSSGSPSDSRSYNDGSSTGNNMLTLELGQSSTRRAAGEMNKGKKPKRHSPRVSIPRLMCFHGQQPSDRDVQHQRSLSDSHIQNRERTPMEQQEPRDNMQEQLDPSRRISSRWNASMMPTKHELSLLQQKITEELDDDTGRPGSSYSNYFRKLQLNPASCLGSHTPVLKLLGFGKRGGNSKARASARRNSKKHNAPDAEGEGDLLLDPQNVDGHRRSYYIPSEERMQNVRAADAPSSSSDHSRGSRYFLAQSKRFSERWRTTSNFQDLELVRNRTLGEILASPNSQGRRESWSTNPLFGEDVTQTGHGLEPDFEIEMDKVHDPAWLAAKDDVCGNTAATTARIPSPSESQLRLQLRQSLVAGYNDEAAMYDQVDSYLQFLETGELANAQSSAVAGCASPMPTLKVSIEDALYQQINRLDVELDELQMQLQLLKMDSALYGEAYANLPQEEVSAKLSNLISDASHVFGPQGWEALFVLDMLIQSDLQLSRFDIFRSTWHSPDSPLDPRIFNMLDDQYSGEMLGARPDRKLLFERVNSALVDVFREQVDLYPWVMPGLKVLHSVWHAEAVMETLVRLIRQEPDKGRVVERAVDKELQWGDGKGEIDGIGMEIEELILDGLIIDFVCQLL